MTTQARNMNRNRRIKETNVISSEAINSEVGWKIGTWNVSGLAGKEDELMQEFQRENLDILGVTETKKKGRGEIEVPGGHLLIYSGVDINARAKEGVGCIINGKHRQLVTKWDSITERILKIEMKLQMPTTLIVVYGPNEDERAANKDEFWEKMGEVVEDIKGRIIILGDMNGRVGRRDEETGEVIGRHGEMPRNNNGVRLINFCILNDLIVTNTFFQHREIHKYTREVKSRGEKSIIDYVLINRSNRKEVIDVRVRRGAEIYSDHYLLKAEIRMKVQEEKNKTQSD